MQKINGIYKDRSSMDWHDLGSALKKTFEEAEQPHLTRLQNMIYWLHEYEGKTYKQIARIVHKKADTVRKINIATRQKVKLGQLGYMNTIPKHKKRIINREKAILQMLWPGEKEENNGSK